jgi:hypothetical protein
VSARLLPVAAGFLPRSFTFVNIVNIHNFSNFYLHVMCLRVLPCRASPLNSGPIRLTRHGKRQFAKHHTSLIRPVKTPQHMPTNATTATTPGSPERTTIDIARSLLAFCCPKSVMASSAMDNAQKTHAARTPMQPMTASLGISGGGIDQGHT